MGQHPEHGVHAVVAMSLNVWNRRWHTGPTPWRAKRALVEGVHAIERAVGYIPAGRIGFGTDDESADYWRAFVRWTREDRWCGEDGTDYHAGLANVRVPVLHVVSDGDRMAARPSDALAFTAVLSNRTVLHAGRGDLAGVRPDHMRMVTSPRSMPIWQAVASWIHARISE
jgi:hypothetical protein